MKRNLVSGIFDSFKYQALWPETITHFSTTELLGVKLHVVAACKVDQNNYLTL